MKRVLPVALLLLFAGSLIALTFLRQSTREPATAEDLAHLPRPEAVTALFAAPDFSLVDQHGQTVSKQSLLGQPYVANFIFTTCHTVCPLLTAKMVRLQRSLPAAPLRFVSFSVDPANDTPEVLAAYAKSWNPEETRWHLLQTTDASLAAVAQGFRVTAQRTDGGVDAVMPSSVFVLVDGRGVVRGVYDSEEPEAFQSLLRQAGALAGTSAPPAPSAPRSGEVLFHELSCANCHEHDELAPRLGGLSGQQVQLDNALLVTADDAYLVESIVAPEAKRVRGFTLKMPSYAGQLSSAELINLVAYIKSLPASLPSDATLAVDPVCHMKVRVTDATLHLTNDAGVSHFFCSAWCRDRYRENPDAYP